MREIKFKGWHKAQKIMYSPEEMGRDQLTLMPDGRGFANIHSTSTRLSRIDGGRKMMPLQYTGLKDKNGKEIYEGDILRDDVGEINEVKFGKLPLGKAGDCVCTYPSFYAKCYGKLGMAPYYECAEIADWMEIIGNIYENPELIATRRE